MVLESEYTGGGGREGEHDRNEGGNLPDGRERKEGGAGWEFSASRASTGRLASRPGLLSPTDRACSHLLLGTKLWGLQPCGVWVEGELSRKCKL